jgi:hypothetical protein
MCSPFPLRPFHRQQYKGQQRLDDFGGGVTESRDANNFVEQYLDVTLPAEDGAQRPGNLAGGK